MTGSGIQAALDGLGDRTREHLERAHRVRHGSKLTLAERDRDRYLDQVRAGLGDCALQGVDEVLAGVDALGGNAAALADRNEVEVGTVTPEAAEIRKGIKPGDKVIVRGQNGLPDGAAVTVGS